MKYENCAVIIFEFETGATSCLIFFEEPDGEMHAEGAFLRSLNGGFLKNFTLRYNFQKNKNNSFEIKRSAIPFIYKSSEIENLVTELESLVESWSEEDLKDFPLSHDKFLVKILNLYNQISLCLENPKDIRPIKFFESI